MHKGERLISGQSGTLTCALPRAASSSSPLPISAARRTTTAPVLPVISRAVTAGEAEPLAFALKLLFTAVTLGCGFRGGEVVPTFFIGATLGCVLGPLLGIPAGFAAAVGLVALFCGAVNCPVASVILAVELFGSGGIVYSAVCLLLLPICSQATPDSTAVRKSCIPSSAPSSSTYTPNKNKKAPRP